MTVAELKRRLTPGTTLRLVENFKGLCDKQRIVVQSNTRGVTFTGDGIDPARPSWMPWPRAEELKDTPDGFAIVFVNGRVAARYTWE